MDFITGILGLVVLSGSLWLIVLAVPVALFVAYKVAKGGKVVTSRIAAFAAVLLAFFLALFGDEIAGRMYLNHLCETEAGVKVYQTVELPAEYWDEKGRPKYLAANGFVDMKLLPDRFIWHNVDEPYVDLVIKIRKRRWQLLDKESHVVLGERISYMRYFGWINQFSSAPNVGEGCRYLGDQNEREKEQNFFSDIFKPEVSKR